MPVPGCYSSPSGRSAAFPYSSRTIFWIRSRVSELIGCAISRYSPSGAFLLGIAINMPLSPSIILISCTTNSPSSVIDTTAFIFPLCATFLTLTSVIFIHLSLVVSCSGCGRPATRTYVSISGSMLSVPLRSTERTAHWIRSRSLSRPRRHSANSRGSYRGSRQYSSPDRHYPRDRHRSGQWNS